jgi:hypothetical protein
MFERCDKQSVTSFATRTVFIQGGPAVAIDVHLCSDHAALMNRPARHFSIGAVVKAKKAKRV